MISLKPNRTVLSGRNPENGRLLLGISEKCLHLGRTSWKNRLVVVRDFLGLRLCRRPSGSG
jgi:hypothetical protein